MSILIGADIVPSPTNIDMFEKSEVETLLGHELYEVLRHADYRIFNLEVPLTDHLSPIEKHGPNLIAPTSCINGFKSMGIDLFTLANNHIMDQGVQGILSTIEALNKFDIAYVGAGKNITKAMEPYYVRIKKKMYGIYACTEHEFSIAGKNSPGANPFDPLESLDHIFNMKKYCDYIIVLYHGGKEHYRYPSPLLQKVCRKMVEKGADLVVCQHNHCIGCKEEYMDGTIVYGTGNFLFDYQTNEYWNSSLLLSIDDNDRINYIPLVKKGEGVRIADKKDAMNILHSFEKRSFEILDEGFIESKYTELANESLPDYYIYFTGKKYDFIFRVLNKLTNYKLQRYYTNKQLPLMRSAIRNYIECETHRELILKGLDYNARKS